MRPKGKTISRIRGIFGGIGGVLGYLTAWYALNRWDWLIAGAVFLVFLILLMLAVTYFTVKLTNFTKN